MGPALEGQESPPYPISNNKCPKGGWGAIGKSPNRWQMVTMKDIARHCGVSVSTVSRVLSGNELISPDTSRKVLDAAKSMGYTPDIIARTLKTNRSDMIGIVFDNHLNHPFFSGIIDSVRIHAEKAGLDVLLLARVRRNGRIDYTETSLSRRMDGIVVVYANVGSESVRKLTKGNIPVVSVDLSEPEASNVFSDYRQGTEELTNWAVNRGHRRIAFIHGEIGYATNERLQGFRDALKSHKLEIPDQYICPGAFNSPELCARKAEELLSLPHPPTCILMPDDYSAVNALRLLRTKGISAPEQFSCAGYDGIPLSGMVTPRLTTFAQDADMIGKKTVELLLLGIQDGPGMTRNLIVRGKLIPGETVAALSPP